MEFNLKNGLISNPGKFEGETLATPFFYEMYQDGAEGPNGLIEIANGDRELCPAIPADTIAVRVVERSDFITLRHFTCKAEIEIWEDAYFSDEDN
jgi:hypothetical protein